MNAATIAALLTRHRWAVLDETHVQEGIARILADAGVTATREAPLGAGSRVDFLTADGIAVEVKVAGSATDVLRQLGRYAASPDVTALVLATTRAAHNTLPLIVGGKTLEVAFLRGGL